MSWMPHGACFAWNPIVLWMRVVADGCIALSYFVIPTFLWRFIKPIGWRAGMVYAAFATFIFLCGLTHVFDIITIWNPIYREDAFVRLLTGIASVATTIGLWRISPILLKHDE